MKAHFDIAVVGSGFAGSLMAMIAQRLGLRAILLERGKHPRFVIGESSTPLSNLLLEELATRYGLTSLLPLSKWGTWRSSHPELACGLKRGFSFFHHALGNTQPIARERQLLVAASPHDAIADTHWYRADFDAYLVGEALRAGVVYLDDVQLTGITEDEHKVRMIGSRDGRAVDVEARFVVDATGSRGFLNRALGLGQRDLPQMPSNTALYSHFSGVQRLENMGGVLLEEAPPYPIDDAAVHHVFEGGWIWVLHFSNGLTSAGIATTNALAQELRLAEGEPGWQRVLQRLPLLRDQFSHATPVLPFRHIPQLGFRASRITGKRWALLPSAAGFVDPLLSTGFPLTLLGVMRLAEILEHNWESPAFVNQLEEYAAQTDTELVATARLIGALYANFGNFPVFSALSLLYFVAASYAETARRLGRPELASSFLLHDQPNFGPQCARVLERARMVGRYADSEAIIEEALQVIEPIDVAGLSNRARHGWYPVDAQDLLNAAYKVHASRGEVLQMLQRCGFSAFTSSQA